MTQFTQERGGAWSFALACSGLACPDAGDPGPVISAGSGFHLVIIRSGAALIRASGGRLLCRAPALICLNDGDTLEFEREQALDGVVVSFDPAIINDQFADRERLLDPENASLTLRQDRFYLLPFIERTGLAGACRELAPALLPVIEDRRQRMEAQLTGQADAYWPCRARSYLLEMLFTVNQVFLDGDQAPGAGIQLLSPEPGGMEEVLLWLNAHFSEETSLEDLSRRFNTNRTTLNERFQALCGMTVKAYVINLRLRFASLLLRDTALPVAEIMERAGFGDSTHFSRMYRKNYRMSPLEYRNTHCWVTRTDAG